MDELLAMLMHVSLVVSMAILAVLVLRRPVRALAGAHAAYHLWALVPVSVFALALPARVKPAALDDVGPAPAAPISSVAEAEFNESVTGPMAEMATLQTAPDAGLSVAALLLATWAVGFASSLAWFMLQHWRTCRAYERISPTDEADVFRAQSDQIGPALVGVTRPKIIIPADFERRFTPDEQVLVLLHERAHRKRGDTRVNMVVCVLVSLFWFNPLMLWASRCFRQDQEMARDAEVLAARPGEAANYSRALLSAQAGAARFMPAGCAWTSRHPLVERVAVLARERPSLARRRWGVATLALACAAGVTGAWASQPAQLRALSGEMLLFDWSGSPGAVERFDHQRVDLRHPGRVNVIFENRRDIALQSASGVAAATTNAGGTLVIGPREDEACLPGEALHGAADLVLRLPRTTELTVGGVSQARLAGEIRGRLQVEDCAHVALDELDRPQAVMAADQSRLLVETVSNRSEITLSDTSALQIGVVDAAMRLDQIGASRSTIGAVTQPLSATIAGASALTVESVNAPDGDFIIVGASQLDIQEGALGELDLRVLGSSTADVRAATRTARISATGAVDVALSDVDRWTIASRPNSDGRLSVNGRSPPP